MSSNEGTKSMTVKIGVSIVVTEESLYCVIIVPEVRFQHIHKQQLSNGNAVFHAACHGMTKADLKRSLIASCPQHHCVSCNRTTADVGNMLFRCVLGQALPADTVQICPLLQMSDMPTSVLRGLFTRGRY